MQGLKEYQDHTADLDAAVLYDLDAAELEPDGPIPQLRDSLVMIIDDEPLNAEVVQAYLEEAGFRRFITCCDSRIAMSLIREHRPDVLLLDLIMPDVSGFDILTEVMRDKTLRHSPAIMLTSSDDADTKLQALKLGATDFLGKPVDPSELSLRLRNTLAAKAYRDSLAEYSTMLEQEVRLRTSELETAQQQVIHCLAAAGEYRDQETGMHVVRVGRYSGIIARVLGADEDWITVLETAAPLHDVGKIGITDTILRKPGRLDADEFETMKEHCLIGTKIVRPQSLHELYSRKGLEVNESPIMRMAATICETHHEKWDGSGYPKGLAGEAIPLEGRIVALADVYDALRSERPYKTAFPIEKCLSIIREGRGTHFDPRVVDAFFCGLDEIKAVGQELVDI